MTAREIAAAIADDARAWARGRWWIVRAPLLLYLAVVGVRHLRDPEHASLLFGGVTFGIHELGHVLFAPLGQWMSIAGGSLSQILAPIAAGAVLLLYRKDGEPQRDWFGASVALAWLSFSMWNLATYVDDADDQALALIGMTDEPIHDWNYLLDSLGLLAADDALAGFLRVLAFATWLGALAFGGWLLNTMARSGAGGAGPATADPSGADPIARVGSNGKQPLPPSSRGWGTR